MWKKKGWGLPGGKASPYFLKINVKNFNDRKLISRNAYLGL